MDRMLNPRIEKQTIYEIYRACRLCGAGAGYKMPIIQNVVDFDGSEVELKQKIRECVQIEVNQDDKMPPLICELCVDKVNDFYEFLDLCRVTNKRTRMRLGLPLQSTSKGSDSGDCILGMTEPVYINDDSDGEPLAKHKNRGSKTVVKKERQVKIKIENTHKLKDTRSSSRPNKRSREPSPARVTRNTRTTHSDESSHTRSQQNAKTKSTPKSILKKGKDVKVKIQNETQHSSRLKRTREKETTKPVVPTKQVKILLTPPPRPASPPGPACGICGHTSKNSVGNSIHMRTHTVTFTSHKLSCNACCLWFSTSEEAAAHHRRHRNMMQPYKCTQCSTNYKQLHAYEEHKKKRCIQTEEVPDIKCEVCWRYFPTRNLCDQHKCGGEDSRPGGKCNKCNRTYALLRNLKKHESACTVKRKGAVKIDPKLQAILKPLRVRLSRCDPLLRTIKGGHVDVSSVPNNYGLDDGCVYPYITHNSFTCVRIKSECSINQRDGMVNIGEGIKEEFCSESFIHWDSDDETDSDNDAPFKPVDSLSALTLKTIFSKHLLGKVPRKRRRVKTEKFDINTDLYNDISKNIDSIIDNLGDDDDAVGDGDEGKRKANLSIDYDDLLGGDKDFDDVIANGGEKFGNNDDFDSLLNNDDDQGSDANDKQDGVSKTNEKETKENDASKNDSTEDNFDNLLKNDDKTSEAIENQDDSDASRRNETDDTKEKANIVSKSETVSFDDLPKNDEQIGETNKHEDEKEGVKDTESNETAKKDTPAANFDDLLKTDEHINDTNKDLQDKVLKDVVNTETIDKSQTGIDDLLKGDDDDKTNEDENDLKASVINTEETIISKMEVNKDVGESLNSVKNTEVKGEENNEKTVDIKDISNEQIVSIDNKTIDKISKDNEEKRIVESMDAIDMVQPKNDMVSELNTSLDDKDNDLNNSSNITKETVQNKDTNTSKVNGTEGNQDDLNLDDVSDSEMDDKVLMDALDAQIGETNDNPQNEDKKSEVTDKEITHEAKNNSKTEKTEQIPNTTEDGPKIDVADQNNDIKEKINDIDRPQNDTGPKTNDKITLDDLISTRENPDLKSLDLDSISDDDFNFDA